MPFSTTQPAQPGAVHRGWDGVDFTIAADVDAAGDRHWWTCR